MENASKALIMAAGVLIGMIIISLAVYLFLSFGSSSAQLHQEQEEQRLNQFNTQFTSYVGLDNTIYDVVTVANLATENNAYYQFTKRPTLTNGKDNYISVKLDSNFIEGGTDKNPDYNTLISDELKKQTNGSLPLYKCEVEISANTQRVYKVFFTKK